MSFAPQSYVDIKQIRTTIEEAPSRRAIVLIECGAVPGVWLAAPVAPASLGDPAAEDFDINRTLVGKVRRGPVIVLRDPSGRYEPGCATRQAAESFDGHGDCQHGLVASVQSMTERGSRLRDHHRQRSDHAENLKAAAESWP